LGPPIGPATGPSASPRSRAIVCVDIKSFILGTSQHRRDARISATAHRDRTKDGLWTPSPRLLAGVVLLGAVLLLGALASAEVASRPGVPSDGAPGLPSPFAGSAVRASEHPASGVTVSLTVNRSQDPAGSPVTFSGSASPSSGAPYGLSWSSLPTGCDSSPPSVTAATGDFTFSCTPTSQGTANVQVTASNSTGASGSGSTSLNVYADLSVTLMLNPNTITENTQLQVQFQISGGLAPFTLAWSGLPSGCSGNAPTTEGSTGSQQFQCNPSMTGGFQVSLKVTDSGMPNPASATSTQQSLQVNSNGNGNNNNNNKNNGSGGSSGNNNNNGSNPLSSLGNLGGILTYLLIGGVVVFVLILITAISTLITAIVVIRRLPSRSAALSAAAPTIPCPKCGTAAPASSKFCPACGQSMAPGKPPG
jgi:hypothetical protein